MSMMTLVSVFPGSLTSNGRAVATSPVVTVSTGPLLKKVKRKKMKLGKKEFPFHHFL